jgi:hypothetical protein
VKAKNCWPIKLAAGTLGITGCFHGTLKKSLRGIFLPIIIVSIFSAKLLFLPDPIQPLPMIDVTISHSLPDQRKF